MPQLPNKSSDRTLSHAHVIETAQILAPGWKHLSPCLGAALESSPFCGNLLRIGTLLHGRNHSSKKSTLISAPAKLATQLLFQADRHRPVRLIRSQSMPAGYLTPRIIGTFVGLSDPKGCSPHSLSANLHHKTRVSPNVDDVLRLEGIRSNHLHDQWTGVSLHRWKNLIVESSGTSDQRKTVSSLIIPLWLKALWETSCDKSCLLDFLLAVERTTQQLILNNDELGNALRHDPRAQQEWASKTFHPQALYPDAIMQACEDIITISPQNNPTEWSQALEIICASMAVRHTYKPAIAPGKYGYDGGVAKSDCVEVTVRELFDLILWDESSGAFDLSRLPPTASHELIDLYQHQRDGERWFQVLSNLPGCDYLMSSPNGMSYELTPTLANIAEVARQLLGEVGERASSLDQISQYLWKTQKLSLRVSSRVSRHRAALGEEMVVHEIANAFLEGGKNGIEMRLDKAHGICTVTHLRLQKSVVSEKLLQTILSSRKVMEPALKTISLSLIRERGLYQDCKGSSCATDLLWNILATPLGPDRRDQLEIVTTPDLTRREREVKRNNEECLEVFRRIISSICKISDDQKIQVQLLAWILNETPNIIDDEVLSCQVKHHDPWIESMILSLPNEILGDEMLQIAFKSSWAVRGKLLTRLVEIRSGTMNVLPGLIQDFTLGETLSLITMYARFLLLKVSGSS